MSRSILIADSITRIGAVAKGAVVVNASHGGVYAAYLAAKLGVAAVVFNDASVGKDAAGTGGLAYLQDLGVPAATVDYRSARIGDGQDMVASGVVSHVNAAALALGVDLGLSCREAASRLVCARSSAAFASEVREASYVIEAGAPRVIAIDSASIVSPQHRDAIVITGSHGGLLGHKPETALKYDVLAALFNDAGVGKDDAGVSRLPALAARGIVAATVAASSARIGDARSTYEDGVISRVNAVAAALGLAESMTAKEFVGRLRAAISKIGQRDGP
jgi:hypothetical protein